MSHHCELLKLTSLESQSLTVRSLLAVYITFSPPHLTTFTLAVCPPSVKSVLLAEGVQTRTVQSFDDEASRGEAAFL